jgi:hypothetical protein
MSQIDFDQTDFRARAVAASKAMLRRLPSGLSPEESGLSYCLVRDPDCSHLRTPIIVIVLICGLLGLSGLVLAIVVGIFAVATAQRAPENFGLLLAIAMVSFVGGLVLMILPVFVERAIVRKALSRRDEDFGSDSEAAGIHFSLEDAATERVMKMLAEDVGLLYIYPEAHYVKIDGLSYEYVIHSKDVVRLALHTNRKNVLLSYAIGDERLDLVVKTRSVRAEYERQELGGSRGFFEQIEAALSYGDSDSGLAT